MKKQLLTLVAALAMYNNSTAQQIFAESFEGSAFPPTGWSIFNNGTGNNWALNDVDPTFASQGVQSMYYEYSSTDPAEAWAFSPGVTLANGDSIVITFDYMAASMDYPESMEVTMGIGQSVAVQTTTLWDEPNIVNEQFQTASIGVKITSNGTFNFGFHCYSATDMYVLLVDNIKIRKVLPSDLEMNAYAGLTRSCSFSNSVEITTAFDNIGSADEVNIPVAFTVNGGPAVTEIIPGPVAAGTAYTYSFLAGADFSTPGTYTVQIYTGLAADGDRSNDTITFNIYSDASGLMSKTSIDTAFVPDDDPAGVQSMLPFCGIANNLGTNIRINRLIIESLPHTYPDDLTLLLISPNGTDSLILASEIGADNPDYPMITFTDTALTNISIFDEDPILTGYYQPQEAPGFAKFNGQDPNGTWTLMITDAAGADIGYLTSWTLEFDNAVGIKELNKVNDLVAVYPNPNHGLFTVRSGNESAVAEILSMNGQVLDRVSLDARSAQTIDLGRLAKGMYFIKAVSETGVQTEKIIIE